MELEMHQTTETCIVVNEDVVFLQDRRMKKIMILLHW